MVQPDDVDDTATVQNRLPIEEDVEEVLVLID